MSELSLTHIAAAANEISPSLPAIRARLDAVAGHSWDVVCDKRSVVVGVMNGDYADADLIAHAPADIAWLLAEVERWKHIAKNDLYGMCWCDAPRPDCCTCPGARGDIHRDEVRA